MVFADIGHPTCSPKTLSQRSSSYINKSQFLCLKRRIGKKGSCTSYREGLAHNFVFLFQKNKKIIMNRMGLKIPDSLVWGVPPSQNQSYAG